MKTPRLDSRILSKIEKIPPAERLAGGRSFWEADLPSPALRSATDAGKSMNLFNNTRVLGVVDDFDSRFNRVFILHTTSYDAKGIARDLGFSVMRLDPKDYNADVEKSIWVARSERLPSATASVKVKTAALLYSIVEDDGDGYAGDVMEGYETRREAEEAAKDYGYDYVVKGTQMWNEPIGQIEESNRYSDYWSVRGRRSSVASELIALGESKPSLRPHLRPIIATVEKTAGRFFTMIDSHSGEMSEPLTDRQLKGLMNRYDLREVSREEDKDSFGNKEVFVYVDGPIPDFDFSPAKPVLPPRNKRERMDRLNYRALDKLYKRRDERRKDEQRREQEALEQQVENVDWDDYTVERRLEPVGYSALMDIAEGLILTEPWGPAVEKLYGRSAQEFVAERLRFE